MGILEQFYEQWMQHQMNKHNRILQQEEIRMKGLSSQVNDLDQTAEAFEHKMEMAAIEMERWIKEKTRAN
jgi:hypothetical protein